MKVKDLRLQIQTYSQKELQMLVVEMYKAVPKKIKDDKGLDKLIEDPEFLKKKRKLANGQVETPDMSLLSDDIETFIEDAKNDYYLAPNSVISKKERTKWRFTAKRFYKDLISAYQNPENRKEAAECMERLYRLFCKATGYYMFVSDEPFVALNIPQESFLEQTLRMKKGVEEPQTWVKSSLSLILDNQDESGYDLTELVEVFVNLLPTPPLTEVAIEEAKKLKLAIEQQKSKTKMGNYQFEGKVNRIVEAVFQLYTALHEWEVAITYWKENYLETREEIRLYKLLDVLKTYNCVDEWRREYNHAIQSGVKPNEELQKTYKFLRTNDHFPSFDDLYLE